MNKKKWYLSKSIWVGVVTLLYGIGKYFQVFDFELTEEKIATILGVIVIVLRFFTKEPVELKKK